VIPVFTDPPIERRWGTSQYLFLDIKLRAVERTDAESLFLVYGRFVHNTVLSRTQILEEGKLKADPQQMNSAPSAFFVLILNNHKLIYVNETAYAPTTDRFAATLKHFISLKHTAFLTLEFERAKERDVPITREQLRILHPYPEVEIVPLSNHGSIQEFVERFSVLRELDFKVLKPNQEVQAARVFEGLQELRRNIDSTQTTLTHSNRSGLDKAEAIKQIELAAGAGNEQVVLHGKDADGNKLKGTTDDIRLELAIAIPDDDQSKAEALALKYEELVANGTLHQDIPAEDHVPRLRRLFSGLF
jgi:hypothetical protein